LGVLVKCLDWNQWGATSVGFEKNIKPSHLEKMCKIKPLHIHIHTHTHTHTHARTHAHTDTYTALTYWCFFLCLLPLPLLKQNVHRTKKLVDGLT